MTEHNPPSPSGARKVPLCKDCRFHKISLEDRFLFMHKFAKCTRPGTSLESQYPGRSLDYSLVNGETKKAGFDACVLVRLPSWPCGPEARLFEPRPRRWWWPL